MRWKLKCPRLRAAIAAAIVLGGVLLQGAAGRSAEPAEDSLKDMRGSLEKAFNSHDAKAIGSLWTKDGIHRSVSTGEQLNGKEAITKAYASLFADEPTCKLTIEMRSAKIESPIAATLSGIAHVEHAFPPATRSQFDARLVRIGGGWLISRVEETDLPLTAAEGLGPLAWLAGQWSDEQSSGKASNHFRWSQGGAFLVRDYRFEKPDGTGLQGSQVFGWDAEQGCVRAWVFDASGSFGEGYWERESENRWTNKLALKLADGRRGSMTQVLDRVDNEHITVQLIDREIDGGALPNGPVAKLVRKAEDAQQPAPKTTEGKSP